MRLVAVNGKVSHKFGHSGHTTDFTSKSKEFAERHSQLFQFIPAPPGKFHTEDIVHGYCLTSIILMFIPAEKNVIAFNDKAVTNYSKLNFPH